VLRFLAWCTIFLQHAFQNTSAHAYPDLHSDWTGRAVSILAWSGGYSVDLFLALSAFLITQLLMREREATGAIDLRRFYIRRALRIWPLYYSYLLFLAVAGIWITQFHLPLRWWVMSALLAPNIANSLWGWTPTIVASHLWTIGVEEQFYLLWPLIAVRNHPRGLVKAALVMLAISFVARTICWLTNAPGSVVWTNTLTRLDPLAVGIMLAVWMRRREYRPSAILRIPLLIFGIATMLVVSAYCDPYWSPNSAMTLFFGYPAVALGCLAILLAFLGLPIKREQPVIRAAIYLGKISYGLYIWHLVALRLTLVALDRPIPFAGEWVDSATFAALCAFGLTIAIAAISYRFLETPFLRLKQRFTLIPSRPA
jgi:peptidoglycan/LPS O-acetylase OafA/YrhL